MSTATTGTWRRLTHAVFTAGWLAEPRAVTACARGGGYARILTVALAAATVACSAGASADAVVVDFWGLGREGEMVQALVADFEREHPGVRVRVQQIPWSAAHEKLLTAYVGGATPDVAQIGNTWIPEFVALRAIAPLDPWIERSAVVAPDRYFDGIWRTNVIDSTVYGIPWYVDTRLIFYRTDLLARAGWTTMPQTWDAWLEMMRDVDRTMGDGRWPIFLPTNEWNVPVILGMQAGSPLLEEGGRRGAFAEPAFRRAFDYYAGLYRDGFAPVLGVNEVANIYQEFARGTFAMWVTGPWNIGELRRRLPPEAQDRWATAPLPGPTGAESGVSTAGGSSLVMFRGTAHTPAAWALIEYLSRPAVQRRFYELTGDLPAQLPAWQDSAFLGDPALRGFYRQLERVRPTPKVPEWESIATKVYEHAETAIRGRVPVDQALRNLDRDVDRILEKRRWLLAREAERGAEDGSPLRQEPP